MGLVREAARAACQLHSCQKRAGGKLSVSGEPYIFHPMRVAGMVTMLDDTFLPLAINDGIIAAAWLHDVYEDTALLPPSINESFGDTVGGYVEELTNRFTKNYYPTMNRKKRKKAEVNRLAEVSPQAQVIKLCDRIDNLQTISDKGRKFSLLYCDESDALAHVLVVAPQLQVAIMQLTQQIREQLA